MLDTLALALIASSALVSAAPAVESYAHSARSSGTASYFSAPLRVVYRYYVLGDVAVGTPSQPAISPILDTGSGDYWIPHLKYDSATSKSYAAINQSFAICYDSGSCNKGDWISETVKIGGGSSSSSITLPDVQMAVSLTAGKGTNGLMGVGPRDGGVRAGSTGRPGALVAMKQQFGTMAFSLYLDPTSQYYQASSKAIQARVIFAGIAPSLYTGNLVQLPLHNTQDWYWTMVASVTDLTGANSSSAPNLNIKNMQALHDSGTTQMVLPAALASDIAKVTGSTRNTSATGLDYAYNCPKSLLQEPLSKTVAFNFVGNVTIKVPISSLGFIDSDGNCQLLVSISSVSSGSILGSAFLRHAYTVFDPENNRLAMAQAAYPSQNTLDTNASITPITAGSQNLPGALAPVFTYPSQGR